MSHAKGVLAVTNRRNPDEERRKREAQTDNQSVHSQNTGQLDNQLSPNSPDYFGPIHYMPMNVTKAEVHTYACPHGLATGTKVPNFLRLPFV